METSRIARIAGIFGAVALVCFVGGPAAVQIGALKPIQGFLLFAIGLLTGVIALLLGLLGLYFTRASAYREGRRRALFGVGVGALILAVVGFMGSSGFGSPRINDITTNPDDPPGFAADPMGAGRDMVYPAGNAPMQRAGYPDLAPIVLAAPPREALTRVSATFERLGWRVTKSDPEAGTLEATSTSKLFHFVDDISVRVRPQGDGSVVDVRSKSRDGQGDLGVNAARIRKLRDALSSGA